MSRCFAYPPPGFELKSRVNDLDVIESTKLEKEKAKKERRKEKKEKKEKRKKDKLGENGKTNKKDRREKKRLKLCNEAENDSKRKEESEQLEKSCLTEEQPATAQKLYDSSDSTQNSNKRKRLSSHSDGNHSNGNSFLIRLPVKHKEPELPPNNKKLCSTSGRPEISAPKKDIISSIPTNQLPPCKEELRATSGRSEITALKKVGTSIIPANQQTCSTSGRNEIPVHDNKAVHVPISSSSKKRNEIPAHDKAVPVPMFSSSKKGPVLKESPFAKLIENWIPPTIQQEMDFDDQDWLFETKKNQSHEAKPNEEELCQRSSSLWPRAFYQPDIDTYILPYTVPF